jgi:hypothetical protein
VDTTTSITLTVFSVKLPFSAIDMGVSNVNQIDIRLIHHVNAGGRVYINVQTTYV